jgi:hypothetical protein
VAVCHTGSLKKLESILTLREDHASRCPSNSNAKEEGESTEVCHGKLGVKLRREALEELVSRSSDHNIIHIQEDVGELGAILVDEERDIGLGGDEAKTMSEEGKPLVPRPGGLFKSIEGLM